MYCLRLAVMLLCGLTVGAGSAASKPAPPKTRLTPALRQAEAAANRIVETFHRTLDFRGIYADEFVNDPTLSSRSVSFNEAEKWKQFDLATRERVFVALMTSLHLWAEYMMIQTANEVPPEIKSLGGKELSFIDKPEPPKTLAELNEGLSQLEKVSNIYRKYFSAAAFKGAAYAESIRKERKRARDNHHNVPRIEHGHAKFGIPESVPVYVVRPEAFDYYFIREKGVMKLYYVDILPDFRLF